MTNGATPDAVGVLTTDADLVVRSWDAWLANASGIAEQDAVGRSLLELFPEIAERGLLARLRRALDEGAVEILAPAFHHYLIPCAVDARPHFERMQQHVTISPLRQSGEADGLIVTIEDVTERCVRERELMWQLESEDEHVRLQAASSLARYSRDPEPLLHVLGDSSWQVRREAVAGVAETANAEAIDRLLAIVQDQHTDIALLNSALSVLERSRGDAVPVLLQLLQHPDANVRMYVALALGNINDRRAVPALVKLLADRDVNVRYHAIEALGRIGSSRAVPPLISIAGARDPFLSFAALDALAAIGDPTAAPAVQALLDDDMLVAAAIDALGTLGNEHVVPALVRQLDTGADAAAIAQALNDIFQRLEAEYGEGQLVADIVRDQITASGARRIVASVAAASDDRLLAIARVLDWIRLPGIENTLCELLQNPLTRRVAESALVNRGSEVTGVLLAQLRQADTEVRKAAAHALGRIGDEQALPGLVAALDDPVPEVVVVVVAALGSVGSRNAFAPLLQLLAHGDAAVRHAAVAAINSLGHPDTAAQVRGLFDSHDSAVRECAVKIAGYFGYADCFPAVLECLNDPSESVRRAAVEQLGFFEDPRVLPALRAALADDSVSIRAVAARALRHLPAPQAHPHLHDALLDADPRVRYQAVQSVAVHRLAEFAPALRELLRQDAAVPVRIVAAQALGELRDSAAIPLLIELADHEETDLACAALAALGQLPGTHAAECLAEALQTADVRRQLAALEAIATGQRSGLLPYVQRAATHTVHPEIRRLALQTLAGSGDDAGIDAVVELTAHEQLADDGIRALAGLETAQVPRIAAGLHHRNADVRWAAVEALARMKHVVAARALADALHDADPRVRFAATQALERLDLFRTQDESGAARPRERSRVL